MQRTYCRCDYLEKENAALRTELDGYNKMMADRHNVIAETAALRKERAEATGEVERRSGNDSCDDCGDLTVMKGHLSAGFANLTHADEVICDLEEMIVGEMAELRDCIVRNVFYRKRCLAFAKERDDFREKAERWEDEAMAGTGRAMILSEEIVRHNKNWATASKEAQLMLKENTALRKERDSLALDARSLRRDNSTLCKDAQALRAELALCDTTEAAHIAEQDRLREQIAALKAAGDAFYHHHPDMCICKDCINWRKAKGE